MNKIFEIFNLSFLSEYFLITAIFCLTFFCLFSINLFLNSDKFSIKLLRFNTQLIFLLIFILVCYLVLVYQLNIPFSNSTSFNDTILNDQLSAVSKSIISLICIFYLMFTYRFIKNQKLNNFEYGTFLLASIFSFFLISFECESIQIYLSISLIGLAFYVLASFKKSSNFSVKSGIKHFALGSFFTIMFLFAICIYYGSLKETIFINCNKNSTNFFLLGYSTVCILLDFLNSTNTLPLIENIELEKFNECSSKVLATSGKGSAGTAVNASNQELFAEALKKIRLDATHIMHLDVNKDSALEFFAEKLNKYEQNDIADWALLYEWAKSMHTTSDGFTKNVPNLPGKNEIETITKTTEVLTDLKTKLEYDMLPKCYYYDALKSRYSGASGLCWDQIGELPETTKIMKEYRQGPLYKAFRAYVDIQNSN